MLLLEMLDDDDSTDLRITWPDGTVEHHRDSGEPEDNRFYRDWAWVPSVIERAYYEGMKRGKQG